MNHLFELVGRAPVLAAQHGLSALLVDGLPSPPQELVADARSQVAAGLKTRLLTLAVVDALGRRGVVPVLLKGYALALRLYPGLPLGRPSSDVDVLVHREQLDACAEAMAAMGLSRVVDESLSDPFEEHHHLSFAGPPGLVEVHFRLFTGFGGGAFDESGLRQRARPFEIEGRSVELLGPEDEFLYLAVHAANHAFLRLSWLADLERYLGYAPQLDWEVMARRARQAGFATAMTTTVALLERELLVTLPEGARRHFPQGGLRRKLDSVLFSRDRLASARVAGHRLGGFALRLLLVDSFARGTRHLIEGGRRYLRQARAKR